MQPKRSTGGGSGGNRELMPEGVQPAFIVGIFGIGQQTQTFKDQTKKLDKILISFELCDGREVTIDNKNEYINWLISREYTFSYYKDSAFKRFCESILGRKLTKEEADGDENGNGMFDPTTLLGMACQVEIMNSTYFSKKYNQDAIEQKVNNVMACSKHMLATLPEPQRELLIFDINEYGTMDKLKQCTKWAKLNKFVQSKVQASEEYKMLQSMSEGGIDEEVSSE